jgi:hypothetical protein
MTYDPISPAHYHEGRKYEPIDVIDDWQLNYRLGCALKYISRNGRKPGEDPIEGLKKAVFYLNKEIQTLEHNSKSPYQVTYKDVLQDQANSYLWDPAVGPVEPEEYTKYYSDSYNPNQDYCGQAEW